MWASLLACGMAVYQALSSAGWKFDEARHFVNVLNMTFEEYTSSENLLGPERVETVLLRGLQRRADQCPTARPPADLLEAWKHVLAVQRMPERAKVHMVHLPAVQPETHDGPAEMDPVLMD